MFYRLCQATLLSFILVCTGCVSTGGSPQGRVAIVDSDSRTHLQNRVTLTDLVAFSEDLTNQIFSTEKIIQWAEKKVPPRLIVGDLINDTQDENLRTRDIEEKVNETINNTGLVTIVDKSNTNFDYVMTMRITEQRQETKDGRALSEYNLRIKILKQNGDLFGSWSDQLTLAKAERKLM